MLSDGGYRAGAGWVLKFSDIGCLGSSAEEAYPRSVSAGERQECFAQGFMAPSMAALHDLECVADHGVGFGVAQHVGVLAGTR